jgi:predicted ester cyclase
MDAGSALIELAKAASRGAIDSIQEIAWNDRLVESFRRLLTAFPDVTVEIEWTIVEDQRAAGWASIRGRHQGEWRGLAATGRPIDVHGMLAVQLADDGSIADFWLANDWLSIATQIGVALTLREQ